MITPAIRQYIEAYMRAMQEGSQNLPYADATGWSPMSAQGERQGRIGWLARPPGFSTNWFNENQDWFDRRNAMEQNRTETMDPSAWDALANARNRQLDYGANRQALMDRLGYTWDPREGLRSDTPDRQQSYQGFGGSQEMSFDRSGLPIRQTSGMFDIDYNPMTDRSVSNYRPQTPSAPAWNPDDAIARTKSFSPYTGSNWKQSAGDSSLWDRELGGSSYGGYGSGGGSGYGSSSAESSQWNSPGYGITPSSGSSDWGQRSQFADAPVRDYGADSKNWEGWKPSYESSVW